MRRRLLPILLFLAAAIVGHVGVILAAPGAIMGTVRDRISAGGTRVNNLQTPPRVSEASRAVVRPSPDLAYTSCAYDLSDGPIRLTMAPFDDYGSLSLFAANTDNFWVKNDRAANGAPIAILLVPRGWEGMVPAGLERVESPTVTGIALFRRLAPTEARFAAARAAGAGDVCTPFRPDPA